MRASKSYYSVVIPFECSFRRSVCHAGTGCPVERRPSIYTVTKLIETCTDLRCPFCSFFIEAPRIGSQGYVPAETDVLRAKQYGHHITETHFDVGQLS